MTQARNYNKLTHKNTYNSFQCDVSPCWKPPEATVETLTTLALELGVFPSMLPRPPYSSIAASLPHIATSHIKLCCEISIRIFFVIAMFFHRTPSFLPLV